MPIMKRKHIKNEQKPVKKSPFTGSKSIVNYLHRTRQIAVLEELLSPTREITVDGQKIPCYSLCSFRLQEKSIGSGGGGIVHKGYHKGDSDNRAVAVKIFNFWDTNSQREIQFLTTHSHDHIICLLGIIWSGDRLNRQPIYSGYIMEYLELGSLHIVIHDLSIEYSTPRICQWIQQIGLALQYLHEHKIIHRDVKPTNVLLAAIDHLKLADFGTARKLSGRNTNTTGRIGTDCYIAPEVVTSNDYGPPADVYSYGVTIWEISHRKHPWMHLKTWKDDQQNVYVELPMESNKMDKNTSDLVRSCWQTSADERPSVSSIVQFFEGRILETESVEGNPTVTHANWIEVLTKRLIARSYRKRGKNANEANRRRPGKGQTNVYDTLKRELYSLIRIHPVFSHIEEKNLKKNFNDLLFWEQKRRSTVPNRWPNEMMEDVLD